MNGRIAHDYVSGDDVSFASRIDDDSIGVSDDGVVDDDIVGGRQPLIYDEADPEVVTLRCVSISTCPVLTEPVTV